MELKNTKKWNYRRWLNLSYSKEVISRFYVGMRNTPDPSQHKELPMNLYLPLASLGGFWHPKIYVIVLQRNIQEQQVLLPLNGSEIPNNQPGMVQKPELKLPTSTGDRWISAISFLQYSKSSTWQGPAVSSPRVVRAAHGPGPVLVFGNETGKWHMEKYPCCKLETHVSKGRFPIATINIFIYIYIYISCVYWYHFVLWIIFANTNNWEQNMEVMLLVFLKLMNRNMF